LMVEAFEQSESIGLVSAYDLKGDQVRGSGFPYGKPIWPGKDVARLYLRTGTFVFGSPTTVMYRSSIVRSQPPFYDESLLHEDTEKCMQILEHWDFGFVPQVLSFLRVGNEAVSSPFRAFQPIALDRYIIVQRYASRFLEPDEAAALKRKSRQLYYEILADEALRFRESAFWTYHKEGLNTLGEALDWSYLTLRTGRKLLGMAANPATTAARLWNHWKRKMAPKTAT
jgi:hypothetical protein